jgi:hypothetical protein
MWVWKCINVSRLIWTTTVRSCPELGGNLFLVSELRCIPLTFAPSMRLRQRDVKLPTYRMKSPFHKSFPPFLHHELPV